MKKFAAFLLLPFFMFSLVVQAAEQDSLPEEEPSIYMKLTEPKRALPLALGAGLLSWGAYELGDTPTEGRRNMALLWGTAAAATGGAVFYQRWTAKKRALRVGAGSVQSAPALVFSYAY